MTTAGHSLGSTQELVGRIYDAAVEPALWCEAIEAIAGAAGCRSGIFYEHDTGTRRSRPLGFHRLDPDFMREYERHYSALDPWNRRVAGWPAGLAAPTYALIRDEEFRRTEFYQDHLRHTGMFYGLGGMVVRSHGRFAVFGVQCAYRDGRFAPRTIRRVEGLMAHLARAYRMQAVLGRARRERETLKDVLHLVGQPVLIVEADGRLVFANRAAEDLLDRSDALMLDGGRLQSAHREDRRRLERALRFDPGGGAPPATVALRRRGAPRATPLVLRAVPLQREAGIPGPGRIALLIESAAPGGAADRLAEAFQLSPAEARLWTELSEGRTLAQVAEVHAVSVNTLRVQLASLFRKVGVHRQAELVRVALQLRRGGG